LREKNTPYFSTVGVTPSLLELQSQQTTAIFSSVLEYFQYNSIFFASMDLATQYYKSYIRLILAFNQGSYQCALYRIHHGYAVSAPGLKVQESWLKT
jgi:hypothetical protein